MATISSAVLCDFAQVREGLLFVASGGITRAFRSTLPAPVGFMIAVVVEVGFDELDVAHELSVAIKEVATAEQIARFNADFQLGPRDVEPGENLYLPVPVDLSQGALRSYGAHDVQVMVDGQIGAYLTFYVKPDPDGAERPAASDDRR